MQYGRVISIDAIRIGERMVEADSLRPAGHVFDPAGPRSMLKKKGKKRKYYQPNPYLRDSKLHRLADAYRPKEPK